MATDRLHTFASRRLTKWSKRTLPGYWTLLQYLTFAGFALFISVRLIGGEPAAPAALAPIHHVTATMTQAPATTAAASPRSAMPTGTSSGPQVSLVDTSGAPVHVPAAAANLAMAALKANFDPAVAASVPVVGGGTWPAPAHAFPGATVGSLVFVAGADADHLTFAASTDADGPATTFSAITSSVTVVRTGSSWAAETAS